MGAQGHTLTVPGRGLEAKYLKLKTDVYFKLLCCHKVILDMIVTFHCATYTLLKVLIT